MKNIREYIKDGHIIQATQRAYDVIYKYQGYVEYRPEKKKIEEPKSEGSQKAPSKKELVELCKSKGIPVNKNDTVDILKEKLELADI